ncbi:hypothetical protein IMSAGC003_00645 [Lachnospiraceae bacterium]|nr:hypothetical protein [Acetatifactor sp.]GFH94115.1 hypothetical protein IMSAGC003_00645 [Lachnospiraceae bacterium]
MRIHTEQTGMTKSAPAAGFRTGRFTQGLRADNSGWLESCGSLFQKQPLDEEQTDHISGGTGHEKTGDRSDVHKIYEAALQGSKTPITSLKTAPKVPYGYLAKDGVITYNGVAFICDEKTNSICLGDVSDPKKTINIPLSGGGHLKVNRGEIGQLSKAIGMFSPEDVNRILRAIHLDTKLQSVQKEMEDLEDSVGEEITSGNENAGTDENTEKQKEAI